MSWREETGREHGAAIYPGLRGRVAVVTGGASGIGEAIVEALVRQQARVVFLDVQAQAGEALVERLKASADAGPVFLRCDLTDAAELKLVLQRIDADFGRVDVLVNNAGNDTRHAIEEVTPESWDRTMAVNLKHHFFMVQGLLPAMRRAGAASVINLSSIAWMIPSTGLPVYVAAKAAIVGLTRTLAHELGGENIRVNCVLPGAIATERQLRLWLTPTYQAEVLARQALKRLITPEEVARMVLFLASDESSAVTNQSFVVDGGWV